MAEEWHKNPIIWAFVFMLASSGLSAIKEYSFDLFGVRIWVWLVCLVLASIIGTVMLAMVLLPQLKGARTRERDGKPFSSEVIWEPYERLLWKARLAGPVGSMTVIRVDGPFCPKCKTGMVGTERGSIAGIGGEEWWKCPNCGALRKAARDERDQQDEVQKIIQGRIHRGER